MVSIGKKPLPEFKTCTEYIESYGLEAAFQLFLGDNDSRELLSSAGKHNIPAKQLNKLGVLIWNTTTAFKCIPAELPTIITKAVLERFIATGDSFGDVVYFYSNLLKVSPTLRSFTEKLEEIEKLGYAFDDPIARTMFLLGEHTELTRLRELWNRGQVSTKDVNKVERILAAIIKFMRPDRVDSSYIITAFFREYYSLHPIPIGLLAEAYFVIINKSPRVWVSEILSATCPEGLNFAIEVLEFKPDPFITSEGSTYSQSEICQIAREKAKDQLHKRYMVVPAEV